MSSTNLNGKMMRLAYSRVSKDTCALVEVNSGAPLLVFSGSKITAGIHPSIKYVDDFDLSELTTIVQQIIDLLNDSICVCDSRSPIRKLLADETRLVTKTAMGELLRLGIAAEGPRTAITIYCPIDKPVVFDEPFAKVCVEEYCAAKDAQLAMFFSGRSEFLASYLFATSDALRGLEGIASLHELQTGELQEICDSLSVTCKRLVLHAESRGNCKGPRLLSPLQQQILKVLSGQAMKKATLVERVCPNDSSRLYKPAGLNELRTMGLVNHQKGIGYFRPDAPPLNLLLDRIYNGGPSG